MKRIGSQLTELEKVFAGPMDKKGLYAEHVRNSPQIKTQLEQALSKGEHPNSQHVYEEVLDLISSQRNAS